MTLLSADLGCLDPCKWYIRCCNFNKFVWHKSSAFVKALGPTCCFCLFISFFFKFISSLPTWWFSILHPYSCWSDHMIKSHLGRKQFILTTGCSPSLKEASSGTQVKRFKQKSQKDTAYSFDSSGLLSSLSHIAHSYLPRYHNNRSGLDTSPSVSN